MIKLSCFWKDLIHKDESSNPKHNDDNSVNIITLVKCGPQWINTAVYFRKKSKTIQEYFQVQGRRPAHQIVKREQISLCITAETRVNMEMKRHERNHRTKFPSDNTLIENQYKFMETNEVTSSLYQTGMEEKEREKLRQL